MDLSALILFAPCTQSSVSYDLIIKQKKNQKKQTEKSRWEGSGMGFDQCICLFDDYGH